MTARFLAHLSATLALVCFVAPGLVLAGPINTINACDEDVGTDASEIAPGVTVSMVNLSESGSMSEPAFIVKDGNPRPHVDCGDAEGSKAIGGGIYNGGGASLYEALFEGIWSDDPIRTLMVEFTPRVRYLSVTGFNSPGDSPVALLADAAGNYLGALVTNSVLSEECVALIPDFDRDVACISNEGSIFLRSGPPIATIYFASDSAAWIDSIAYSLPEPGTLALLGLGLVGLGFAKRRKAI